MKIKTGDKVKMLSGKDSGKTGKILQVFVEEGKVVVEGLNLMIKNQHPKKQGEKGQRIQFPSPVASSRVALLCPICGLPTRVGKGQIISEDKSKNLKNRVCKKYQTESILALKAKFAYKNSNAVPKVEKVSVNIGINARNAENNYADNV